MRILLLTSTLPWPIHGGGNQRTNLLHRALSERGEVHVVALSEYGLTRQDHWSAVAERFGGKDYFDRCLAEHRAPWRWAGRLSPKLPSRLARSLGGWGIDYRPDRAIAQRLRGLIEAQDYGLIVSRYMWPLARSGALGVRPTILDVDDFRSDVIENELATHPPSGLKKLWVQRKLKQVLRVERRVLSGCDHVWVAKSSDLHRIGHDRCSVLSNIPFTPAGGSPQQPCPENEGSRVVLMVGTLEHPVNVRAIDAFIAGPWPKIRRAVPDAVFRIVGSGMTPAMRETWGQTPGVDPVGFAETLRDAYGEAALAVVPIREGGGTKIKVLESLLMGRACVCLQHSLRGYEDVLADGESIRVAQDESQLAEHCVALLLNPSRRAALAQAGRSKVLANYSYASFAGRVTDTIDAVLQNTHQARHVRVSGDTPPEVSGSATTR